MPGLILHQQAAISCFHQAPATIAAGGLRVQVGGLPVATVPKIPVTGCLFQVPAPSGTKPQPCVVVSWANMSTRVRVLGQPVLLQAPPGPGPGGGVCQSIEQIPQGPPVVRAMQVRVVAT